ncbi:MAG: TonB family protein [bacterium]
MAEVAREFAEQIEAARLAVERGDRSAAVVALNAAIDATRGDPGLCREYADALIRLGTLRQELGEPAEAEQLFIEAIGIGERHLGTDHPVLVVALNELSRLYIRQSAHARAEPLLKRLLEIKRAKGEDHPEVATILAGLAVVRRGLGDDAAAEELYRSALRIREKVLAPNHMGIVITLEHLSETCAARGKFAEALALLQRALPTRESAVGAEHATVRGLRTRIADLEFQVMEEAGKAPIVAAAPAPVPTSAHVEETARVATAAPAPVPAPVAKEAEVVPAPVVAAVPKRPTPPQPRTTQPTADEPAGPGQLVYLYQPDPPPPRRSRPRDRVATPPFSMAVAAASLIAAPTQTAAPAQLAAPTQMAAPTLVAAHSQLAAPALSVTSIADTFDAPDVQWAGGSSVASEELVPSHRAVAIGRAPALGKSVPMLLEKRSSRYRPAMAAAVAFAVAALGVGSYAAYTHAHAAAQTSVDASPIAVAQAQPAKATATIGASAIAAVTRHDSSRATSAAPALIAPTTKAPRSAVQENIPSLPGVPIALPTVAGVSMPNIVTPNVDSVMRASTKAERDSYADQITPAGRLRSTGYADDRSSTLPVLIGAAPQPRFPEALRNQPIDGQVVVQFLVDENGRVEPSTMKVVRSPHELFTTAVRNILPKFRFEPGRTAAPESKPRAEWVQYSIQFGAVK